LPTSKNPGRVEEPYTFPVFCGLTLLSTLLFQDQPFAQSFEEEAEEINLPPEHRAPSIMHPAACHRRQHTVLSHKHTLCRENRDES
jgi:hypothetical protein